MVHNGSSGFGTGFSSISVIPGVKIDAILCIILTKGKIKK